MNRRTTGCVVSVFMGLLLVGACSRAEGDGGHGGDVDPCAGKGCAAACTLCDPARSSCSGTAVLGYCDERGHCGLPFPVCPPPSECTVDGDCPVIQSCGLCPDGSLVCPEARCIDGQCIVQYPECPAECESADDCPQIGMPCERCPDGEVVCPGFDCIRGACVAHFPHCDGYEPCEGKACGARCTACDPRDPDCVETGVLKFCDEAGACQASYPECPPPPECVTSEDCPGAGACPACPSGLCAELECVSGQCIFVCPPEPPPECTSASDCPAVGMPCVPCPDGFAACPAVECVGGACVIRFPTCDGHDPCAGKACGDTCDLCGGACGSPVAMYCDASGRCGLPFPVCDDVCRLPPDSGPCDAAMPRWYFDAATRKCAPFVYGGCQGNANNFMTATACAAACAPSAQACDVISCDTGTSCVYLGTDAACAPPCAEDESCPPGFACTCGASCPGCRDCLSVCTPAR